MNLKKFSKRRKLAAIISAVLVFALAVTGTMAWSSLNDEVTNEWGDTLTPGGNGHDDFDGNEIKNVWYENYGAAPLFVRIRLDEYMEFGTGASAKPLMKNALRADKTSWAPHIPAAIGTPHVCAHSSIELESPGVDFHDFWTWTMGSVLGERYYRPTLPTDPNAGDVKQDQFFTSPGVVEGRTLQAIPGCTVVTMAQWNADGSLPGPFWVVDSDGWAYWAEPLPPKSATGLLLNKVVQSTKPDTSYYYAINVRFQASDKEDIGDLRQNATPEGQALLDKVSGVQSLDDLLDAAIAAANIELAKDSPVGTYDPTAVAALTAARNAALAVKAQGAAASETDKQNAIDDINANMPLILATNPTLPTVTPPAGPNGFEPQIDTTNPDLSHDTQVDVSGGALTKMNRFATIALDSILSNPADIVGLTASAVDPLLDPYIKIYNNTFTYGTPPTTIGDGKLSLVCEWYPLTQGERNAMNNGLTSITYNGSYTHMYVTTDIILTNAAGTQSATVTVTFVFAHSNMTLIP